MYPVFLKLTLLFLCANVSCRILSKKNLHHVKKTLYLITMLSNDIRMPQLKAVNNLHFIKLTYSSAYISKAGTRYVPDPYKRCSKTCSAAFQLSIEIRKWQVDGKIAVRTSVLALKITQLVVYCDYGTTVLGNKEQTFAQLIYLEDPVLFQVSQCCLW